MTEPQISVVIPTFNGAEYLERTLSSVIKLAEPRTVEVLVIDDGSTDATVSIARSFESKLTIRVIQPAPRHNWTAMANIGLHEAQAPWMSVLPQDDAWTGERYKCFEGVRADASLVLMQSLFVDDHDRVVGKWRLPSHLFRGADREAILASLYVQNWVALPSVTFRVTEARDIGGFREDLWYTADWNLWLRLLMNGGEAQLSKCYGSFFRIHEQSQTMQFSAQLGDFRRQVSGVQEGVMHTLTNGRNLRKYIAAGEISTEVDVQLAAAHHKKQSLRGWVRLGMLIGGRPLATVTFVRNSAIFDRAVSRAKIAFRKRVSSGTPVESSSFPAVTQLRQPIPEELEISLPSEGRPQRRYRVMNMASRRSLAWLWRHVATQRALTLFVCIAGPVGCAWWAAFFAGQDVNFDLLTYHYYNAYALLHGRLFIDNAPVDLSSMINPIMDVPIYLMMHSLPGRLEGAIVGAVQGLNPVLIFFIARKLRFRPVLCVLAALIATISGGFASELGNSMGDTIVSIPLLLGILWVLIGFERESGASRAGRHSNRHSVSKQARPAYFGAGAMFGLGLGFKFSEVAFVGAALLCLVVNRARVRSMLDRVLSAGIGFILGLIASYGWWGYLLWRRFDDPFAFTQWSLHFFPSKYLPPLSVHLPGSPFTARSIEQLLFYPLYWWHNGGLVGEISIKERSIPVAFVLAWAFVIVGAGARLFHAVRVRLLRTNEKALLQPDLGRSLDGYVISVFLVCLIVWGQLFGIYRYVLVLEELAPVVALCALRGLLTYLSPLRVLSWSSNHPALRRATVDSVFAVFSCFCFATESPSNYWSRTPYAPHEFVLQVPAYFENHRPDAVIDLAQPITFVNALLPSNVIGLGNLLPFYSNASRAINARDVARVEANNGVVAVAFWPSNGTASLSAATLASLPSYGLRGFTQGPCTISNLKIGGNIDPVAFCVLVRGTRNFGL